jgi:hypothetical protein
MALASFDIFTFKVLLFAVSGLKRLKTRQLHKRKRDEFIEFSINIAHT